MERFSKDPNFLESILQTMTDGLMVVDSEGNILFYNRAAEEITGYSREEVIGRQCTILDTDTCVIPSESGKQKKCSLFETGCVTKKRCRIKSKDGRTVYLLKNAVVLKNDKGDVVGAVEAMTDITPLYMKEMELEELKSELQHEYGFMGLLGTSPMMQRLYEQIQNAAMSEAPVIICGESGTGKELVAHAIYKLSRRQNGPFVKINCAALNEFLLESELFGHVKGSFTGALKDRQGRFEAADKGSLFLDEIGDMPASMQVKLLRVLQEREVERVGDNRPIKVNVRLITATNKDLCCLMDAGRFREDLFYRINVIPINAPALRERKEDIPILVSHFLRKISFANQKNIQNVSPAAMEAIETFLWPGNIRQLINALEYAAITCRSETIDISDIPEYIFQKNEKTISTTKNPRNNKNKEDILSVLAKNNWNRTLAAKDLGMSRVTLWKLMKGLNIDDKH
ncbi:MAG: sigma 54-interacting transcriptional regulator [Thermodesulfovibrionales bacterium]|nr:sigma 54-interacting transcriptional regulator [Thermodesulfovibrionales bacterium]